MKTLANEIMQMIEAAEPRGLTCHEIAERLYLGRDVVGNCLGTMKHRLWHMRSRRDGQTIIRAARKDKE